MDYYKKMGIALYSDVSQQECFYQHIAKLVTFLNTKIDDFAVQKDIDDKRDGYRVLLEPPTGPGTNIQLKGNHKIEIYILVKDEKNVTRVRLRIKDISSGGKGVSVIVPFRDTENRYKENVKVVLHVVLGDVSFNVSGIIKYTEDLNVTRGQDRFLKKHYPNEYQEILKAPEVEHTIDYGVIQDIKTQSASASIPEEKIKDKNIQIIDGVLNIVDAKKTS